MPHCHRMPSQSSEQIHPTCTQHDQKHTNSRNVIVPISGTFPFFVSRRVHKGGQRGSQPTLKTHLFYILFRGKLWYFLKFVLTYCCTLHNFNPPQNPQMYSSKDALVREVVCIVYLVGKSTTHQIHLAILLLVQTR